jgi:inosine/xanthosine triphosphatase
MKIIVGSANPIKILGAELAFGQMLPGIELEIVGKDVASGVDHQPLSYKDTIRGATNRAQAALASDETAAYGVGIEGGLEQIEGKWYDIQWAVVLSRSGNSARGKSLGIPIPDSFMVDILAGMELGDVADKAFGTTNIKQAGGYIGEVTRGTVRREEMCQQAVVSALIPITNPDLFGGV